MHVSIEDEGTPRLLARVRVRVRVVDSPSGKDRPAVGPSLSSTLSILE